MQEKERTINTEEFDLSSFDDPIALLQILKQKNKEPFAAIVGNEDLFFERDTKDGIITPQGIAEKYDLPINFVRGLVTTKDITPVGYIPVFSVSEFEAFYENHDFSNPPIVDAFLYELDHMRTNYSYKPLLLLAIIKNANKNGEISLSEVIDFYFAFYQKRQKLGLVIEKGDSSFVKNANDRAAAKKTILTYPLKIYCDKGFLFYDSRTETITVVSELWHYLLALDDFSNICSRCEAILDEYYYTSST